MRFQRFAGEGGSSFSGTTSRRPAQDVTDSRRVPLLATLRRRHLVVVQALGDRAQGITTRTLAVNTHTTDLVRCRGAVAVDRGRRRAGPRDSGQLSALAHNNTAPAGSCQSVCTVDDDTCPYFSALSRTQPDLDKGDVAALLRRVAETIEKLGDVMVQDIHLQHRGDGRRGRTHDDRLASGRPGGGSSGVIREQRCPLDGPRPPSRQRGRSRRLQRASCRAAQIARN
jgi:hypothetical protein